MQLRVVRWVAFALVAASVALGLAGCAGPRDADAARTLSRPTRPPRSTTTSTLPPSTTTVPATTTTTRPPPPPPPRTTTTPAPRIPQSFARLSGDLLAYQGLGTWVDVYDWSRTYSHAETPPVGPADVDRMVDVGVQTLYIQTGKWDAPTDVLEPDLLLPIIRRAHARGLRVVAWYLPTLVDPVTDLRRLQAAARLGVEGLAVDIESRDVPDVATRNQRLIDLSAALRHSLPGQPIGAIVLPPVVLDRINPAYWPDFPWPALRSLYDLWIPMAYWTNRTSASGYRDAYRYSTENVTLVRQHLGIPGAPVHLAGGIGDKTIPADVAAMVRGAGEHGVAGASLYDWRTTRADAWPELQKLRQ